jgi:hypothetical protein
MNLLNIRKVGYGVRSIDELRAPGSRPEPQPTIVTPADNPQRSILDDVRFTSGAAPRQRTAGQGDDRFASPPPSKRKARSTSKTWNASSARCWSAWPVTH